MIWDKVGLRFRLIRIQPFLGLGYSLKLSFARSTVSYCSSPKMNRNRKVNLISERFRVDQFNKKRVYYHLVHCRFYVSWSLLDRLPQTRLGRLRR